MLFLKWQRPNEDDAARERNEIGLNNFVGRLFAQIQGLNAQEAESGYIERTRFHLESDIGLLQLLMINIW